MSTISRFRFKTKQVEPHISEEQETIWEKKILGDHNSKALLNTIMFMNELHFALHSGAEPHQLHHILCQIKLVEKPGERSCLIYCTKKKPLRVTLED